MNKKQTIVDILKQKRLYFDGGTGTVLQRRGLNVGECPEIFTLAHPDVIAELHREYYISGADIVKTNTFGVNARKYENYKEYISAALDIACKVRDEFTDKFVALDIGPSGKLLKPLGELEFEDAVELFAKNIRAAEGLGADLILIETMTDIYEAKAAVLAAKENSDLPVFVTLVFDESGKMLTGATPEAAIATLEGLGVDAVGVNCSLGPDKLLPVVRRMCEVSSLPIIVNPNAGLPIERGGELCYDIDGREFAQYMLQAAEIGASVLGGCCGTTPDYIRETRALTECTKYKYPVKKHISCISSYTHALTLGERPLLIGERINPTGKPRLKSALREGDIGYVLSEAISEEEAGAHALDVNVGLPEIDEPEVMRRVIREIQAVCALPLQIDSSNPEVLEGAMRIYNGKPLVNSVNGKESSMRAVLPLVKKYGGVVIALTMDEDGIPSDASGRVAIARKILATAEEYGLGKEDIVFDPLAMAVSADAQAASVTLAALREIESMGCMTSLGVSNVSFGLPSRDKINAAYFTMALSDGLDLAIMNPHSVAMTDAYRSFMALRGLDPDFAEYISYARTEESATKNTTPKEMIESLSHAIINGLRSKAREICKGKLASEDPLGIVNSDIIPALGEVGRKFERGEAYLPELLMSAEAANAAFDEIKKRLPSASSESGKRVVLATVKGDIHDIGKNIVKTLLESHGFLVIDLGRDVSPEDVLASVRESGARLVGLSALMTTTVGAMEETVKLLHSECECAVMVGGAVLNPEYADRIGADYYAKDAMDGVRIATEFYEK